VDNPKITMAQADVPYESFHPDHAVYAEKHVPGAKRNDEKRSYVDFGTERHDDKERYTSSKVMALEWEKIWSKTWLLCGHESDLPEVGSFMKIDFGPESILVVRQKDESLRAIYNVCQHRGMQLESRDFGTNVKFNCPFHLWQYDLSGKCIKVTDRESFRTEALDHSLDIEQVRVETWKGWVFISMDRDAIPLLDYLGEDLVTRLEAYPFEHMKRMSDKRQEWDANWKLALEAFIEGYHLQGLHPELIPLADTYRIQQDIFPNGHSVAISRFLMPSEQYAHRLKAKMTGEHQLFMREAGVDPATFQGGPADVREIIIKSKRTHAEASGYDFSKLDDEQLIDDWVVKFFPSCTFNTHPEGVLVQRFLPHPTDPEKVVYISQIWALPDRELPSYMGVPSDADRSGKTIRRPSYLEKGDLESLGPVISQDATTMPKIQKRLRSKGYKGAIYSEQEIVIRQFYAEYDRHLNA
jgi:phenylpropionate dioxygenase-like ring-hydroxylating dioxygenase large terminal subunit